MENKGPLQFISSHPAQHQLVLQKGQCQKKLSIFSIPTIPTNQPKQPTKTTNQPTNQPLQPTKHAPKQNQLVLQKGRCKGELKTISARPAIPTNKLNPPKQPNQSHLAQPASKQTNKPTTLPNQPINHPSNQPTHTVLCARECILAALLAMDRLSLLVCSS
jgi:hypothetical protein